MDKPENRLTTSFPGTPPDADTERKKRFLDLIADGTRVVHACAQVRIVRQTYYQVWRLDPQFVAAEQLARQRAREREQAERERERDEADAERREQAERKRRRMAAVELAQEVNGRGLTEATKRVNEDSAVLLTDEGVQRAVAFFSKNVLDAAKVGDQLEPALPEPPALPPPHQDAAVPDTPPLTCREFVERDLGPAALPLARFYPRLEWLLDRAESHEVKTVILDVGKGSGKGVLAAIFLARRLREALAHPRPAEAYGLLPNAGIGVVNLSVSGNQAQLAIFSDLRELIKSSPWFQALKPKVLEAAGRIDFEAQRVIAFSGCGDATGVEGYAWIAAAVDEVDRLPETASHGGKRADDLVDPVENTMLTRIGARRKLLVMSWPEHDDSYIQRRVARAVESGIVTDLTADFAASPIVRDDPSADATRKAALTEKPWADYPAEVYLTRDGSLVVHAPTWQLKPDADLREFAEALTTREFQAARMIGARPKRAGSNPFVRDLEMIRRNANRTRMHPLDPSGRWYEWFRGSPEHVYYAHIDAALSGDAAGLCVGHYEAGKVVLDLVLEIKAPPGGEIRLQSLRDYLYELKDTRGFDIVTATNDGWEGHSCRQDIQEHGIRGAIYSVDRTREPYDQWLTCHQKMQVDYYDYDPYYECAADLQDMGKKIDHRPKGKKDVTDAAAAVVAQLWAKYGSRQRIGEIL